MFEKYKEKFGLKYEAQWKIYYYTVKTADAERLKDLMNTSVSTAAIRDLNMSLVLDYDNAIGDKFPRQDFMRAWLNHASGDSLVAFNENKQVVGQLKNL